MVKNLASIARGKEITAGFNADAKASGGICIGDNATSTYNENVVIGSNANCEGSYRVTHVGANSFNSGSLNVNIGRLNEIIGGRRQIVIGNENYTTPNVIYQNIFGHGIDKRNDGEEGTYISPIRVDGTLVGNNYVVTYNTDTKELKHTGINLDTTGNALQGLQSVTTIDNTTTNEIVVKQGSNELHCVDTHIQMTNGNNAICIGPDADAAYTHGNGPARVAIGPSAGIDGQGEGTVAIGPSAGSQDQGNHAVAIGDTAGGRGGMGPRSIAIGYQTGTDNNAQPAGSICIGDHAQTQVGAAHAIAIGQETNVGEYAINAIAIGKYTNVGEDAINAIAIGKDTNVTGSNSIAIGQGTNVTVSNSIVLGYGVTATNDEAFYVNPVRAADTINDAGAMVLVRKDGEIMEYDSIQNLITSPVNGIYNDIYQIRDDIELHIVKQREGLSLNGYDVHTINGGTTYPLSIANNDNDLYGRVFYVPDTTQTGAAQIVLPSHTTTSPGMNFIVTRDENAEVAIKSPSVDVEIVHSDSTTSDGDVSFDSSSQSNMVKLIAVTQSKWIMQ